MAEDELVFVDSFLGDYQGQRPPHLIVKGEGLVDLQSARGGWRYLVHIHVLLLALGCIPAEGLRAEGSAHYPSYEKLIA